MNSLRQEFNMRLDGMERRIDAMDTKFESKFNALIIVVASTGIAVAGTLIAFRL